MRYYAKLTDEQILKLLNGITHVLFFTIPLTMILLVCCSCGSTKDTIPVKTIREVLRTDTIYLRQLEYDSIFVSTDKYLDRSRDTIVIKQHDVEFRYKLLRDTIYQTKLELHHDSIPYQVTVTKTKDITRPLTWFDHLTRASFFILLGIAGFWFLNKSKDIYRIIRKFIIL